MKISIVTPSVRSNQLEVVFKSLKRQSFPSFEWVVVGPLEVIREASQIVKNHTFRVNLIEEYDKSDGDYYNLNKAWNQAFRECIGELVISIVDGLWFPPDTLERLWSHYQNNPKSCVSCIGHQYDRIENGKPEHMVWRDPRVRSDFGTFYEVPHTEMELCISSFPKQAVKDVGGVDEEFDRYAAMSEKEMMARMYAAGYKLYLDQSIEYRAIKHNRLSEEWDKKYQEGIPYYQECLRKIAQGERLNIDKNSKRV